ncbi:unnamed protein product [Ilex paraguariensis]|uniref:Uncharacterized protein n=1 Tax=Ilex paraguariensis TaxID=185542 RepID=A0ABC8T172_9AQUA
MEIDRHLRPLPINCGSKVNESLVNSIDGRPDACLGGSTLAEGINLTMIVEDVYAQTQARAGKVLADQTRFDREEVTESVIEQNSYHTIATPIEKQQNIEKGNASVNSKASNQVKVRDCVQGELVRNKDAGYKGVQSLTQNHHLILDGQSEQWQIVKSKGKENVIEEQPLRLEVNLSSEIECSVKRAVEPSNKF